MRTQATSGLPARGHRTAGNEAGVFLAGPNVDVKPRPLASYVLATVIRGGSVPRLCVLQVHDDCTQVVKGWRAFELGRRM